MRKRYLVVSIVALLAAAALVWAQLPDGNANSPAYGSSAHQGSGMYFLSDGSLGFSVNKTSKVQVNANGLRVMSLATTPVNGAAATATLTYTNGVVIAAGNTVTVNGKVYTFVTPIGVAEGNVLVVAGEDASLTNLVAAINLTAAPGKYVAAAAHPTVSAAVDTGAHTVTLTARTKGVAGNSLTLAESLDGTTITDAFSNTPSGVDGTLGSAGDVLIDASYVYVCTGACTISDANWKRAGISTF